MQEPTTSKLLVEWRGRISGFANLLQASLNKILWWIRRRVALFLLFNRLTNKLLEAVDVVLNSFPARQVWVFFTKTREEDSQRVLKYFFQYSVYETCTAHLFPELF